MTAKNGDARLDKTWKPSVVDLQRADRDALGRYTLTGDRVTDLDAIEEFMASGHEKMPHTGYTPHGYAIYRVLGEQGDEQFWAAKETMIA